MDPLRCSLAGGSVTTKAVTFVARSIVRCSKLYPISVREVWDSRAPHPLSFDQDEICKTPPASILRFQRILCSRPLKIICLLVEVVSRVVRNGFDQLLWCGGRWSAPDSFLLAFPLQQLVSPHSYRSCLMTFRGLSIDFSKGYFKPPVHAEKQESAIGKRVVRLLSLLLRLQHINTSVVLGYALSPSKLKTFWVGVFNCLLVSWVSVFAITMEERLSCTCMRRRWGRGDSSPRPVLGSFMFDHSCLIPV